MGFNVDPNQNNNNSVALGKRKQNSSYAKWIGSITVAFGVGLMVFGGRDSMKKILSVADVKLLQSLGQTLTMGGGRILMYAMTAEDYSHKECVQRGLGWRGLTHSILDIASLALPKMEILGSMLPFELAKSAITDLVSNALDNTKNLWQNTPDDNQLGSKKILQRTVAAGSGALASSVASKVITYIDGGFYATLLKSGCMSMANTGTQMFVLEWLKEKKELTITQFAIFSIGEGILGSLITIPYAQTLHQNALDNRQAAPSQPSALNPNPDDLSKQKADLEMQRANLVSQKPQLDAQIKTYNDKKAEFTKKMDGLKDQGYQDCARWRREGGLTVDALLKGDEVKLRNGKATLTLQYAPTPNPASAVVAYNQGVDNYYQGRSSYNQRLNAATQLNCLQSRPVSFPTPANNNSPSSASIPPAILLHVPAYEESSNPHASLESSDAASEGNELQSMEPQQNPVSVPLIEEERSEADASSESSEQIIEMPLSPLEGSGNNNSAPIQKNQILAKLQLQYPIIGKKYKTIDQLQQVIQILEREMKSCNSEEQKELEIEINLLKAVKKDLTQIKSNLFAH